MNPILIICNGKSSGQINWKWLKNKNLDTFGMNNAYKMYEQLDFYPTYYSCLDNVVIQSHQKKIEELIELNKIKKLFLHSACNFKKHKSYQRVDKAPQELGLFFDEDEISTKFDGFRSWMNTGSDSVQISIMMGYKIIYIIGADGYVPLQNKSKNLNGIIHEVIESPKDDPNYWFDNYLEKGDKYNTPYGSNLGWKKTGLVCRKNNIKIFDISNGQNTLPKISYQEFVTQINPIKFL